MTRRTRVDHYHHRGNGCLWFFLAALVVGLFDTYPTAGAIVAAVVIVSILAAVAVELRRRRR